MTDIQMTVKRPQNTDEKVQLELIKSSKLFYKLDASILPHLSLTKQKKISKAYKTKHQDQLHKHEKPKPNTYTKTDFHKNCSKISQYLKR